MGQIDSAFSNRVRSAFPGSNRCPGALPRCFPTKQRAARVESRRMLRNPATQTTTAYGSADRADPRSSRTAAQYGRRGSIESNLSLRSSRNLGIGQTHFRIVHKHRLQAVSSEMAQEMIETLPLAVLFDFPGVAPKVEDSAALNSPVKQRGGQMDPIDLEPAAHPIPSRGSGSPLHDVASQADG